VSDTRTAVLIEDDADVSDPIRGVLAQAGITVHPANTGTSGVLQVRDHSPDIVILEFGLPDITGLEVIRRIRSFSNVHMISQWLRASALRP
jgi:DNA-binding response OmpR family regulator